MKTPQIRVVAALAALTCSAFAADERTSTTVGGNTARDRNDTIRSSDTRVNTTGMDTDASEVTTLNRGDRRFVEKAAFQGYNEIRIARLAAQRSTDPKVRSYAEQVAQDHEKSHAELNQLASKKKVSLADFEDHMERPFNRLSGKTGAEFEKSFLEHMSGAHEDAIEMFEKAARKSDDAEIAAFASKQLPVLQQHKATVDELLKAGKK